MADPMEPTGDRWADLRAALAADARALATVVDHDHLGLAMLLAERDELTSVLRELAASGADIAAERLEARDRLIDRARRVLGEETDDE